jgi:Pentatricopeptide repeat domain/PPR repeat
MPSREFIPEGLCLHILSTAARHGHPALATSVFDALATLKIQYQSHHFLPLIEAYVRCGDIRQAFIVIDIMRQSCLTPPQTYMLSPLIKEIGKSTQSLDRAFFILQDIIQKEGKRIDIVAFNCLLAACIHLNDASRAISTYRDAETLKVQPNIETFNILLNAAQIVAHTDLAMYILSDLKAAQITPNANTYRHVIMTFLRHPGALYDQAFLYLEEMKASGYIPAAGIYSSFVKKCVYQNDDRALSLLEEMKNLGYTTKILERWVRNAMRVGAGSTAVGIKVARMRDVRREEMEASREIFRELKSGKGEDVVEQRYDDDDVNNILDQ